MLVMVVYPLSEFVCTLLHVNHGSVAPCVGLSALYCMLVLVVLLLVRVCLHSLMLVMEVLLLVRVSMHSIAC